MEWGGFELRPFDYENRDPPIQPKWKPASGVGKQNQNHTILSVLPFSHNFY